jgi:ABC-type uncharacterized transport system involved in gliding motility auxiliary subunit
MASPDVNTDVGRRRGAESVLFLALVAASLVVLNVLVHYQSFRFDFTRQGLYSLSAGSRNVVSRLEDELEITAYFTGNLPPPFNNTERAVRDLLSEYEAAASGSISLRFVDPDTTEEQDEARDAGIQEVQHQVYENDSVQIRNGYRGIVFRYAGERQTIPVVEDTSGLEYAITQTIRQLAGETLPIGVLSGHESPTPTQGLSAFRTALPSYELREVDASEAIDPELRALLIVTPQDELSDTELQNINAYVMNGGSLGVFGGTTNISIQGQPSATPVESGINRLLTPWGMTLGSSLVADAQSQRLPLRQGFPLPVPYPPLPIIHFTDQQQEHPVLFRQSDTTFFFASPIETTTEFLELGGVILGQSGEELSWLLEGDDIDLRPRMPQEWAVPSSTGPHTVLAAVEGRLPSAFPASALSSPDGSDGPAVAAPSEAVENVRVVVFGSGVLIQDPFQPQPPPGAPPQQLRGGLKLALNAVDWLAQDLDLIAIRAKTVEDPQLEVPQNIPMDGAAAEGEAGEEGAAEAGEPASQAAIEAWNATKFRYRWGLTLGPSLLVLLFGLFWYWRRGQRRQQIAAMGKGLRDAQ